MKKLLFTLFISLLCVQFNVLLAARFEDGYIVKSGDTVQCKIKIQETIFGLDEFRLQSEVITKDSAGKITIFKPADIQGFGFNFYKEPITYVSKVLEREKKAIFVKVVMLGKRLNLFKYEERSTGASFTFGSSVGPGNGSKATIYYILLDNAKRELIQSGQIVNSNRKRAKEFFKEQPELLSLYEKKATHFELIPEFVQAANAL